LRIYGSTLDEIVTSLSDKIRQQLQDVGTLAVNPIFIIGCSVTLPWRLS